MKKKNKKESPETDANKANVSALAERFFARMAELFAILRKEKSKESWPDWVWICFGGVLKQIFPKHFPQLWDETGPSFVAGFVLGCVPKLEEILSQPSSENTEMGLKTAFAITPKENQKELLEFFQAKDFKKEIGQYVSMEKMASDFWSWPKEYRAAFAKGLLAGTMIDEDLGIFVERASGTTFTLNGTLWISWTEIAKCSDVSDAFRSIEAAYHNRNYSVPTHDAFKQHAHRIGLSQFLRKQKQLRSK